MNAKEKRPKHQRLRRFLRLVGEDGFEPSKRNATDLQSAPFGHSGICLLYTSTSEFLCSIKEIFGVNIDELLFGKKITEVALLSELRNKPIKKVLT